MGQHTEGQDKHANHIWKYGTGRIALYTTDPAIWERLRRYYSDIAVEMTRYYRRGEPRAFARQYIAPMAKRSTFERILGVKMDKDV